MERKLICMDYEVFAEFWCVTFAIPQDNRIVQIWDSREDLIEFYEAHCNDVFVGFNIKNYDQWIMKCILAGLDPWKMNEWIITQGRQGWEFSDVLRYYRLIIFDVMSGYRNSLKLLEGFMGDSIEETKVDFRTMRKLTDEEIEDVLFYNAHDVTECLEVMLQRHLTKDPNDFLPKLVLINRFNKPIDWLSKTSASLTEAILGATKQEFNDEWDLQIPDTLSIKKYRFVLDWYLDPKNRNPDAFLECKVAGMDCKFAWGGMHGSRSINIENKPIIDCDASSLYPVIMLRYNLMSRALSEKGKRLFKEIVDMRLEAKKKGDKMLANALKICINSMYGVSRAKESAMYDPRNGTSVCVAGQLLLLDLMEHLEEIPSVVTIDSNTDGIYFTYDNTDETFDKIDEVVREFEERTGLTMEFDDFISIYHPNVANYIAVSPDGKLKRKGALFKECDFEDGQIPIIRDAIVNKLVSNIPIEKTIMECNDLMKFQNVIRLTSAFKYATTKVIERWNGLYGDPSGKLPYKTMRVFASTDIDDISIYKVSARNDSAQIWPNTSPKVFIDNGNVKGKSVPDKLDRQFYIQLAIFRFRTIYDERDLIDD